MPDGREGDNVLDVDTVCYSSIQNQILCSTSLATIERSFRIFRQSIYDESLQKLKELKKLSGEIEIDEALFSGYRKGSKRG